jgi:transcriptional regulator with XRE-family HTH domain
METRKSDNISDLVREVVAKLRTLRQERGLTTSELSRAVLAVSGLKIPQSVIVNLENDRRETMTINELLAFAQFFQVSPLWLLGSDLYPRCLTCSDQVPTGFTCNNCKRVGD